GDALQALSPGRRTGERTATRLPEPGRTGLVRVPDREDGLEPLGEAPPIGSLDVIFPVLHGTFGEDGTVQGLFELASVPYAGAGVLGSALGMDKVVQKTLWRGLGLPVVDFVTLRRRDFETDLGGVISRIEVAIGYPCFKIGRAHV